MNATLCNRDHPEYGAATIPLPIPDEEYAHCMELLEALEIGSVSGHDCYVDQITDAPPSLDMLEGTMINVDELDFLARSLDRYTAEELAKFQCMTATREHWDMSTLINLSFSCEQASVITDFSKLEEAGRSHYLTMHGGGVPVEEYNQLNGVGIARSLIADGGGRITPYGVVFENAMRIEPLYEGHSFPPYADKPYLMDFTIETDREGELTFFLPQPEKRLERLLERAEIYSAEQMDIRTWRIYLPDAVADRLDVPHESLYEMNRLCAAVGRMDQSEIQKLSAVVLYAQPEYAFQIRQLAENLDLFDYAEGIQTAEGYGRYLIQESGHYEYDENLDAYYRYCLRCKPQEGDYDGYLWCFDKRIPELRQANNRTVGRVSFANGELIEYTDAAEYLKAVREELPYQSTSGFRFETLTEDPQVRKAVDDAICNLYGEENPRPLEDYTGAQTTMKMEM